MVDVLATGYPSLDYITPVSHSPMVGETALIEHIVDDSNATFGGCGANVVTALANLRIQTGLATILGDDYQGRLYQEQVSRSRIDARNIIIMPREKTSRSMLYRNPSGEYQNFFFPGASDAWDDTLTLKGLDRTRYALVTVGPYKYNEQFVKLVVEAGVPLIWQLKPDVKAYPPDRAKMFLKSSKVILMNHIEAEYLLNVTNTDNLHDLWNDTTEVMIVTQGESGCTVYTPDSEAVVPAVKTSVQDTTGAGDGFTAGFIAGMLREYDWVKCAQLGSVLASFVVERVGCQTNLPDWTKLQTRYEKNFGTL